MKKAIIKLFCISTFIGSSIFTDAQTIFTTKHNLAISGPGTVKALTETQICKFCHTPHNARPQAPLWNRNNAGGPYTLYSSSTLNATLGQPDGSSILCLSCHDGTVALGQIVSGPAISFAAANTFMPVGKTRLTTDLSNDHPISFVYSAALATADGQLLAPSAIIAPVSLKNSKVQCTSCHDPHKNITGGTSFLVTTTRTSALCLSCHNRTHWAGNTSHRTSTRTWNGTLPDPWPNTPYLNVAENACESCHNPHNSAGRIRLLKYAAEESNCLDCHNGNGATKNIQLQFGKLSKHNVSGYTGLHQPNEAVRVITNRHVECVDCHNPHAANNTTALAPLANGFLRGVSGINQAGTVVSQVTNSYEVCYKCHSGNPGSLASIFPRQFPQNDVRTEFATTNPSFHPVVAANPVTLAPGNFVNLGGLPNMNTNTVIYCTSCHASDGTGAPAGPHGSSWPFILRFQFSTVAFADGRTAVPVESASTFELCYSCHNRTTVVGGTNGWSKHPKHTQKGSCNMCHDPHGSTKTNLINFRTDIVLPARSGRREYIDDGFRAGTCYLECHGTNHDPKNYN